MGLQLPASEVNEVAQTIWSQIDTNSKMCAGCGKPRAIQEERNGEWMAGIQVAVNPVKPAGAGFYAINEHYNPRNPDYTIKVLLDEGADTYILERWKMKPQPVCDYHLDDVYFDHLGDLFFHATFEDLASLSPSSSSDDSTSDD